MGDLGVTYTVHLWLVGKRVVDFLLVLIELFSPALTVEALWADTGRNCAIWKGWATLSANFRGKGSRPPTNFGIRKLSPRAITWCCLRDPTFSRFDTIPACDTQTDTHTHTHTHTRWWLLLAHGLRRAGIKKACSRWMTLNVTQGHRNCLYTIGYTSLLISGLLAITTPSGTVSDTLPHLQCRWPAVTMRSPSFSKR